MPVDRVSSGPMDYDVCVKSILIGESSVGKSSLLYRYSDNDWNPHYIATIGVDFKVLTFERHAKVVKLQIWDTAGQERFRTITHSYYRGTHGVLLVFDVTSRETFERLPEWVGDVRRFGPEGIPLVVVGNKADAPATRRAVTAEEAKAYADSLDSPYIETSARDNRNVEEAFALILDACMERRLKASTSGSMHVPEGRAVRIDGVPRRTVGPEGSICQC